MNSETGLPGEEIPVSKDLNFLREKVYNFDWYDIYPPSEQDLQEANSRKQFK